MKQTPLDNLLQDWANRQQCRDEHTQELADAVVRQAREQALLRLRSSAPATLRPSLLWRLGYVACGAALACLVFAVPRVFHVGSGQDDATAQAPASAQLQWSTEDEALFLSLDQFFCGRLSWVVETDADIRLGLPESEPDPSDVAQPTVLVRLVVLSRAFHEQDWRRVWGVEIATRSETVVETTTDGVRASQLALWAYALADGAVAVDCDMELRSPVTIAVKCSDVFVSGKPKCVVSMQTDQGELRVYLTAELPQSERGGAA